MKGFPSCLSFLWLAKRLFVVSPSPKKASLHSSDLFGDDGNMASQKTSRRRRQREKKVFRHTLREPDWRQKKWMGRGSCFCVLCYCKWKRWHFFLLLFHFREAYFLSLFFSLSFSFFALSFSKEMRRKSCRGRGLIETNGDTNGRKKEGSKRKQIWKRD